MYLIAIAWMYVVVMMTIAEATSANGTVLGAIFTFLLYGVLPCGILMYLLSTPARRKALRAREASEVASNQPDAGSHAPAAPQTSSVPAVRKES